MQLDEEKVEMMTYAMGLAVMELALADKSLTQQAIIDKLEQFRRNTGNVIGKGCNWDVAEIVELSGWKGVKTGTVTGHQE